MVNQLILLFAISLMGIISVPTARAQSSAAVAEAIQNYRVANERQILADFADLLALPNVADNLDDMQANAEHIASLMEQRGFDTRILNAGNAPYVYGEMLSAAATDTLLIYAHFDGQSVQPENWTHPPFTPTLLDGPVQDGGQPVDIASVEGEFDPEWRIYARSAGDDKMPIIALMHVIDAMRKAGIEPSVNIKLLFDGEEERGSPTVLPLLEEHRDLLTADLMLFCDGPMHQSRQAQLVFGVRGGLNFDITSYGATHPLHSGHYGNWAPNPIMRLSYLLTSMRAEDGRILIDGFYDDVALLGEAERAAIEAMPNIEDTLREELAVHTPEGSGARIEELITRPALNVRGIVAGGVGAQGRNIVLSAATTAINMRLVPDQQPDDVRELIEAHIRNEGYHIVYDEPSVETLLGHEKVVKLDWRGNGYPGLRTALDHPMSRRLIGLLREIRPELIITPSMGGGLPLHAFDAVLDIPIIILPLANHDNNQHAEDENLRLQNLWDAMEIYGVVLAGFADRAD